MRGSRRLLFPFQTRPAPRALALAFVGLAIARCPGSGPNCELESASVPLSDGLEESSGVAPSRAHPGIVWTHVDGGAPYLYAVDRAGGLVGKVRLGGVELTDAEDLSLATCDGRTCLYLADLGDNEERRDTVAILRLPEPDPRVDTLARPTRFPLLLPHGPRDVEAIFVLPGERLYLVSKGRSAPVSVYRYPGPLRAGSAPVLQEVQRLSDGPRVLPRQVTGASASLDGSVVAIRTYETVSLFREEGDTLAPLDPGTVNVRSLREPQGEGVGVGEDGEIVLSSEGGPLGQPGSLSALRCSL